MAAQLRHDSGTSLFRQGRARLPTVRSGCVRIRSAASERRLGSDVDGCADGDHGPDSVDLSVGYRDAAVGPVDLAMKRADPAESVAQAVNLDSPARVDSQFSSAFAIGFIRVGNVQCAMKSALLDLRVDDVVPFRRLVITFPFLRSLRLATERNLVCLDRFSVAEKCHFPVRLLNHYLVGSYGPAGLGLRRSLANDRNGRSNYEREYWEGASGFFHRLSSDPTIESSRLARVARMDSQLRRLRQISRADGVA